MRAAHETASVQGGDPTGTGTGGESIYGPAFDDEIDNRLLHTERGVLAYANAGRNTNASQFYVLYKSARHLDLKHTVFGRLVGGRETLSAIEAVPTDDEDRPRERVVITGARAVAGTRDGWRRTRARGGGGSNSLHSV
jgi:peptidyl-prolyl cis-trans isomerase-like 2